MMAQFSVRNGQVVHADGTTRPATVEEGAMYEQLRRMAEALNEVAVCGSGFLAGRCDADCMARTMTQVVAEYGEKERAAAH